MPDRCPRCGMEDGRGIMCPRPDAAPVAWRTVAWLLVLLALFVLTLLLLR